MRFLIITIFLFFTLTSLSQKRDRSFFVFGGIDFSHLSAPHDSILSKALISPFFGIERLIPLKDATSLRIGLSFSSKRSINTDNNIKYNNSFLSVHASYYYPLSKSVNIFAGIQYSLLFSSYTQDGVVKEYMPDYRSYSSINLGFDFKLQSHLNLGITYEIPINNLNLEVWPNIKVKLGILIDKDLFKADEKRTRIIESVNQVQVLTNTALLVRLKSYKKQLDLLTEDKYTSRREAIINHRDEENMDIINAFKDEFNFCPVYFFYNSDTKNIIDKDFYNVFIGKDLQLDSTIIFKLDTFLIGELGYVVTDSTKAYGYGDVYVNGFNSADGYARTETSSSDFVNFGFNIRNQDACFIQKPFPGFTSGYFAFVKRSPSAIIKKVNENLHKYKEKYLK